MITFQRQIGQAPNATTTTNIHGKLRTRTVDENNMYSSLSLRPSRMKELDKVVHLGEVIKRLHFLDTIPHPVLVLFIKIN